MENLSGMKLSRLRGDQASETKQIAVRYTLRVRSTRNIMSQRRVFWEYVLWILLDRETVCIFACRRIQVVCVTVVRPNAVLASTAPVKKFPHVPNPRLSDTATRSRRSPCTPTTSWRCSTTYGRPCAPMPSSSLAPTLSHSFWTR